jgi:O-antigen ligase
MLFYTTAAFSTLIAGNTDPLSRPEGNAVFIGIQVGLYSVACFFIVTRWQPFLQGALAIKWIAPLLLLALASSIWSQDPALTLRRSILLVATTAFGVYFATRFEPSEQLRLLAWTLGITVCLSLLAGILIREYGVDASRHSGDWQGVFSQKNGLARAMVLSVLVFLFARKGFNRWLRWLGLSASLGLLFLSHSLSGAMILVLMLGAIPLVRFLRTRVTFAIPVGLSLCAVFLALIHFLTPSIPALLEFANRDSTLTGRTELWSALLPSAAKRPLLGYGFDAFWLGMKCESANILLTVGWPATHAHNGFLDLWLDLGGIGVALFLAAYLLLWRRAVRVLRSSPGPTAVWLCIYLIFMLLYNLPESALLRENTIFWVLYTATAVNLYLYELPFATTSEVVYNHDSQSNLDYLPGRVARYV